MAVEDVIIVYLMLLLIPLSITLGTINLFQFYRFYQLKQMRFLEMRKTTLIIIYCIIALVSSLLILPYITFAHIITSPHAYTSSTQWIHHNISKTLFAIVLSSKWILEFIHEISTCFLIIVIAIRCWCLYYDYKFAIASTERVWRQQINSNETNLWIVCKKYYGNYQFILYFIACLSVIILSIFIALHLLIGLQLYGFVADFTVAAPVSIFVFWLYSKIRITQDQYMIRYELKRLSICVCIILLSFAIWIINERWFIHHSYLYSICIWLMYIIDLIFVYFTVYFQTQWVIKQARLQLHQQSAAEASSFGSRSNGKDIRMVDVLRSKDGFTAFINHCVGELNVEGLLFLVEVSQFKATLLQFHRDELMASDGIDVIKENLHRMIFTEKQQKKQETEHEHERYTVSRLSSLRKRVSSMIKGMPDAAAPDTSVVSSATAAAVSDNSDGTPKGGTLRIRMRRSTTLHEDVSKFQQDILEKTWLPISKNIYLLSRITYADNENVTEEEEMITPPPSNECTPISTNCNTPATGTDRDKSLRFSQLKHLSIGDSRDTHPFALKLNQMSPSLSTPKKSSPIRISFKHMIKSKSTSSADAAIKETVSIQWIFKHCKSLFTKYIDTTSELSVNISSEIRYTLNSFFNLKAEKAFEFIRNLNIDQLTDEEKERIANDAEYHTLLIKIYLYHCFDVAFSNVWGLIRDDVFLRFSSTEKYRQLNITKTQQKSSKSNKQLTQSRTSSPKLNAATPTIKETKAYLDDVEIQKASMAYSDDDESVVLNIDALEVRN